MLDLKPIPEHKQKFRRDWGLSTLVGLTQQAPRMGHNSGEQVSGAYKKRAKFVEAAVWPQQLTLPRQVSTTKDGCRVFKILEGRRIGGIQEDGARVVVEENTHHGGAALTRYVISPLFQSKQDALSWATTHMGVTS